MAASRANELQAEDSGRAHRKALSQKGYGNSAQDSGSSTSLRIYWLCSAALQRCGVNIPQITQHCCNRFMSGPSNSPDPPPLTKRPNRLKVFDRLPPPPTHQHPNSHTHTYTHNSTTRTHTHGRHPTQSVRSRATHRHPHTLVHAHAFKHTDSDRTFCDICQGQGFRSIATHTTFEHFETDARLNM